MSSSAALQLFLSTEMLDVVTASVHIKLSSHSSANAVEMHRCLLCSIAATMHLSFTNCYSKKLLHMTRLSLKQNRCSH